MTKTTGTTTRILAIAPWTKGFGYAVLEGRGSFVDWGLKTVKGNKNSECLKRIKDLIEYNRPNALVLEDTSGKVARRAPRIRALIRKIAALASENKIEVVFFSHREVAESLLPNENATKYEVAQYLATRYPDELAHRLPPKRTAWKGEDARRKIFDAVALTEYYFSKPSK
jgi:Holliday junction resolvasome RuvABC endonuclease subunit